jgi:hypothetical protein
MDNPTFVQVAQDSLGALADGSIVRIPALKMGVPAGASKWDLFALGGRMFNVKEGTIGTAITFSAADNAGIVLTAPSFRFTVPTGTTVFPRRLNLALIPGATTVDNEIALLYTAADSYSSGGTAVTPLNWRTDNPRATGVTNCYYCSGSAIVEAALTSVRVLHQEIYSVAAAFATSYNLNINKTVAFDDLVPIVGPASVLLFVSAKTAAVTGYFSFDWAEVPTVSAINAV